MIKKINYLNDHGYDVTVNTTSRGYTSLFVFKKDGGIVAHANYFATTSELEVTILDKKYIQLYKPNAHFIDVAKTSLDLVIRKI